MKLKGCRNKVRHVSKKKAQAHLTGLRKKRPTYVGQVYTCPECGYYHVGRSPKEVRRDRKKESRKESNL